MDGDNKLPDSVCPMTRRLELFASLMDSNRQERTMARLIVLWSWAGELVALQEQSNLNRKVMEYIQRGSVLRVVYPENADAERREAV